NQPQKEREDPASESGLAIHRAPLMLVIAARKVVEKLLLVEVGRLFHDHIPPREQGHPGHFRDQSAYAAPVTADRQIDAAEDIVKLQAVSLKEGALQKRFGNLEANHVVIAIGGIAVFGHLYHVETEFGPDVGLGIIAIGYGVAVFPFQLGKFQGDHTIDGGMPAVIGSIVGESAERESIFVKVRGVPQERFHEVATAHVVEKIAEELIAERIVAHVLQNASAVGVGVGLLQVLFRGVREALEQQGLNVVVPHQVHDLLVGQHRIARREGRAQADKYDQRKTPREMSFQRVHEQALDAEMSPGGYLDH